MRLLPDGTADPCFGTHGPGLSLLGPGLFQDLRTRLRVQENGAIVFGFFSGERAKNGSLTNGSYGIARFNSAGEADPTFGGGAGWQLYDFGDSSNLVTAGLAIDPSGDYFITGDVRPELGETSVGLMKVVGSTAIFGSGFESGDVCAWSASAR